MYDYSKNNENLKNIAKDDIDVFNNLEETLYRTAVRFYEKICSDKIIAKETLCEIKFHSLVENFLQQKSYNISVIEHTINGPSSVLYQVLFKDFVKSNYKCYEEGIFKEIYEILKKFEKNKYSNYYYDRYYDIRITYDGFKKHNLIEITNSILAAEIEYTSFCEDSDKFRFVISLNSNGFPVRSDQFCTIKICYNDDAKGALQKINSIISKLNKYIRENNPIKEGVYDIQGKKIDIPKTDWNQLIVNKQLMDQIKFHIIDFIENIDKIKRSGLKTSRGIIICGQPGTGKTLFLKILMSNLKIPTIIVKPKDVTSYASTASEKLDIIYEFANLINPVMIIFEDGDIFLSKRGMNEHPQILSDFLNKIDGIKENNGIITIVTSNQPELLDEAVGNRPKRFDYILKFPLPGPEERFLILYNNLKNHLNEILTEYLRIKAKELNGYTGAHLVEIAERMKYHLIYSNNENALLTKEIIDSVIENFNFPKYKKNNENQLGFL